MAKRAWQNITFPVKREGFRDGTEMAILERRFTRQEDNGRLSSSVPFSVVTFVVWTILHPAFRHSLCLRLMHCLKGGVIDSTPNG